MSRSLARTAAAVAGTTLAVTSAFAATAVAAPTGDGAVPTFQEFAASTFQDPTAATSSTATSRPRRPGRCASSTTRWSPSRTPSTEGLIVNTVSGRDDKWSATQALNLTYCVSTKFGTDYSRVVTAMAAGAGQWEAATAKVNFVHVPAQDGSCTTRNSERALLGRADQDQPVHRPGVLPQHVEVVAQRARQRQEPVQLRLLDPEQHPGPRAGPHPRLPPRAHPPRGRHLLRGQQLASADPLRLGVDHALPPVQRDLGRPQHDRPATGRRRARSTAADRNPSGDALGPRLAGGRVVSGTRRGGGRMSVTRSAHGSPAPTRTTSAAPPEKSTTVVGSVPHSPESSTRSTRWSRASLTVQPSVIGSLSPGRISVEESNGSPSSASRARTTGCSGMRTPTVRFFGCSRRRGTSWVAGQDERVRTRASRP